MSREDYFLEPAVPGPNGEEETWARIKDLTAEEAAVVEGALNIGSRPDGYGDFGNGCAELCLIPESKARENLSYWLVRCRHVKQNEDRRGGRLANVALTFQSRDLQEKDHIISMTEQFADLIRGKLNTTAQGKEKHVDHRFEVFDEDTQQSVVFDATDTVMWGPVGYEEDWNGENWNYQVKEILYRHRSGH